METEMSYKGTGNPGRGRRRGKLMARNNAQANISQAHNNPIITNPCEGVTPDVIDCLVTDIRCLVCGLSTALLAMTSPPPLPAIRPWWAGLAAESPRTHDGPVRTAGEHGGPGMGNKDAGRFRAICDGPLCSGSAHCSHGPRSTMPPPRRVRARPERANRN